MNPAEKKLLEETFGERMPPQLELEIFAIMRAFSVDRDIAVTVAQLIYKHLSDNVIREAGLMNYETMRIAQIRELQ